MRKNVRVLRLNRETLRNLDAEPLRGAAGGGMVAEPVDPYSQAGASCVQSCFFNTCYATCPWPGQVAVAQ